jgi:hypothetical protein
MPASRAISATFRATFEPRTSKSRSSARISSVFSSRRPRRALFSRSLADTISLSAFRLVSGMLTRSIAADGSRTHEPPPSRQPGAWSGGRYSGRPQLLGDSSTWPRTRPIAGLLRAGERSPTKRLVPLRSRRGDRSLDYLPGVRLFQGRDHADQRLPALLRLRKLSGASKAASRRLTACSARMRITTARRSKPPLSLLVRSSPAARNPPS